MTPKPKHAGGTGRTESILDSIGETPLVELTRVRPPEGARVFAKWEGANPTGSMKDRMALAMIEEAERDGRLDPGQRIVENTAGSTGSSLALVCTVRGYPFSVVSADCFAEEKLNTMRALGADLEVLPTPDGRQYPGVVEDMRARVREIRDETGAYYTNQIDNEHQLEGYRAFGEEVLRDCPAVTDFVMGVGTGGCAMGTAMAFRADDADVRVTLVEPEESPVLTEGERGSHDIEGVSVLDAPPLLDDDLYDDVLAIPEQEARRFARRLAAAEGVFAGASSGLNVAGAVRVAEGLPSDAAVVTVACDTGLKYLRGDLYREPV